MIETGTSIDSEGKKIKIDSTSTLNNIRIIRESMLSFKPVKTLEIGLGDGASALTILSTLREQSQAGFAHTAIDPFQKKNAGGSSIRVITDEGFSNHFRFFEDYSAITLAMLVKEKEKFDFVFIDGSHIFEDVFLDFYYSSILLNNGGYMLFDDCTDPHISKVIKFIKSNYSEILEPLNLSAFDQPNKPVKKRIGNLLGIRQLIGFRKISNPPRTWNTKFHNF